MIMSSNFTIAQHSSFFLAIEAIVLNVVMSTCFQCYCLLSLYGDNYRDDYKSLEQDFTKFVATHSSKLETGGLNNYCHHQC